MRYVKALLFSALVIGLMTGSAFAGTTYVNAGAAGANFTVSLEATGINRSVTVSGTGAGNTLAAPNLAAIAYTAGQALVSNNLLVVTFTNAAFTGAPLNVCAMNATGDRGVANATPSAGDTTFNFQLNPTTDANLGSGNSVYLTSGACGAGAINVPVQIASGSTARTATVMIEAITSGGIPIDTSTAATLATVRAEYAIGNSSSTHTVDYLGTPGNGTRVLNAGIVSLTADSNAAGVANVVNITRTSNDYNTNFGAQNAGLTVAAVVGLTDTASWQGVSTVYLVAGGTACVIANNVAASTSPSGTVSLSVSAASFNGSASVSHNLCVLANGTSALQTRTIQANVNVNVTGTGANDPAASAFANAQTWDLNAYQATVPWMVNNVYVPTYCLINNSSTASSANVLLDVVSSEGGVVIDNATLGSIAASTSKMATFTANEATLAGGTPVSLSTLGVDQRYAPRLTVTSSPGNVSITCIQTDPVTGAKRAVPVLTNPSLAGERYLRQ